MGWYSKWIKPYGSQNRKIYPFLSHPESPLASHQQVITSITEDHSGNLWIGNYNSMGVNKFNPESKVFKDYLKGATVWKLFLDSDGILWAGTGQGLYKYDSSVDNFIPFTTSGLAASIPEVRSIVEDSQKNLWLTTNRPNC